MRITVKVEIKKKEWRKLGFTALIGGIAAIVYASYDVATRGITYSLVSLVLLLSALLFLSLSAEI